MNITLNITANNVTYTEGESLLISFPSPFKYITSFNSISFDFVPLETVANGHDIYVRWTYDIAEVSKTTGNPDVSWSAWEPYSLNGSVVSDVADLYSKILARNSFDLQFRLVRRGNDGIARRIDRIVMDMGQTDPPEEPSVSPYTDDGCATGYNDGDAYVASACQTTNFCTGVNLNCDPNLLFRPYETMAPGIALYRDLACAVGEMFGHCIRYFKVNPRKESADTVLKEYSLFTVDDVKDIKVLVPDNAFPQNNVQFMPFDMDFQESIEIHIVREHFQRAFGFDKLPEEKDYLYFPLLDRMYEVHSAYLHRDFMMKEYYYKITLYKWQDKANVMRENPEIAQYVDDLTVNFDELLQPEINNEFDKVTKPEQYKTISIGGFDHIRSLINETLEIPTEELNNYFTVVGKYYYKMTSIERNSLAVRYKLQVNRTIENNTGFSFWFKHEKANFDPQVNTTDTLLRGFNESENKGYSMKLNYGNDSGVPFTESLDFQINEITYTFDDLPKLTKSKWYGIMINQMNEFSQATLHIWEMKYNPNQPGANRTTDLRLIYTKNIDITPTAVQPTTTAYDLYAGTFDITNVRIWKESIEEEKQPILLNQYVVRDSHQTLLVDNAIPPLRMVREYVR